jgi:hypothetical protein
MQGRIAEINNTINDLRDEEMVARYSKFNCPDSPEKPTDPGGQQWDYSEPIQTAPVTAAGTQVGCLLE